MGYLCPRKRGDGTRVGGLGTGSLLPDDKIITAAHVVYDKQNRALFDIFTIYFGRTEASKYAERATGIVADCQIPPEYAARHFEESKKGV